LFYAIAFGGAVLVAGLIWALRLTMGPAAATASLVATAVLYMPLPLVAGLILEHFQGRRPLLSREWAALRAGFWRTYARNALAAVCVIGAVLALGVLTAAAGGWLQVPGAGHFATNDAELRRRILEISPTMDPSTALPSVAALIAITAVQGILAGITINGLFAFGEEYGWRGVLAAELAPLGSFRANLVIGTLWGLWHAPIIMLGHNYGTEWGWGIPAMVAWTIPLGFLLSWVRERTGSVLSAAILHGAYNGVIGVFTFTVVGGNVLISVPMGLLMAAALSVLAVATWVLLPPRRKGQPWPAVAQAAALGEKT